MNTPRINPNDPKWTAYVLGELDAADAEAVERLLESSAEARALVDELKMSSVALEDAFDAQPAHTLTPAQRAAVRRAADVPAHSWFARVPRRSAWSLGAVTAALLVAAVLQLPRSQQAALSPVQGRPAPREVGAPTSETSTQAPATEVPASPEGTLARSSAEPQPVQDRSGSSDKTTALTTPAASPTTSANAKDGEGERRDANAPVGSLQETLVVTGAAPVVETQSTRRELQSGAPAAVAGPAVPASPPPPVSGLTDRGRLAARGGGLGIVAGNGNAVSGVTDRFARTRPSLGTESYTRTNENGFVRVSQEPLATFSIDVDTASYSNVRRFLNQNQLPPADAVRIEELVNYFTYDYARPTGGRPIGASMAVTAAPWNPRNRLLRVGIRARDIDERRRPLSNLVFLIDVSGSMVMPQKLPLVKSGLKMLVDQLGENDVVSIVVYAGSSGLALPPTRGDRKDVIARALDSLEAGGSTNGASGIQLAYNQATANFIRGGVNRVILVTDGDFNVGITDQSQLTRLIEDRAKSGVFLSVLGFGMGNLKDSTMEKLADMGNGHYAYIDTLNEARKVLVEQMSGTLVTVAKDVKIQVDFNPAKVEAYRLIGYENRVLRPEDFNNDLKDAGDMGAGHTVTALFEIVPRGGAVPGASVDPSVFQPATQTAPQAASNSRDLLVLRMRYKLPDASESTRMDLPLADRDVKFSDADPDARFAAAVAAFGMILKDSPYRGSATLGWVLDTATTSQGQDRGGYRDEFVSLVRKAIALSNRGRRD
jgi:Ca-activated chloride channel family protein